MEISTPKNDVAQALAEYTHKEQRQILRAARHLQSFFNLTSVELTDEEEADKIIKELEEEK